MTLYPSEVKHTIVDIDGVAPYYCIELERERNLNVMEFTIELDEETGRDEAELREIILRRLQNVLSFKPDELDLVEPGGVERTKVGKVQRAYDHRE